MFRFIYKYNHTNTPDIPLAQENYSFEEITQLFEWRDHYSPEFQDLKVSHSMQEPADPDDICVFPIDFQSTPIDSIMYLVEKICGDAETYYPDNKKIVLLYTTTEPFYFRQEDHIILKVLQKFKNINFILSGSGHTHMTTTGEKILNMPNVTFVPKLWYFDRVHLNKNIKNHAGYHFLNEEEDIPEDTPDYITCPNKFLLTMRNPRPHRLIMSSLVENNETLNATRYSRNWSANGLYMQDMLQDKEIGIQESTYQTYLMFHSLDVLRQEVSEKQYRSIIDTTFNYSHVLDMNSIADRGLPAPWLYDNINIVIVAGGEGQGYGYADEKQMIPMYYKKPFISFGCKGMNEEMEKIGFSVFRDCWDLSWSNADTLWERVNGCHELMKELQALALDDIVAVLDKTSEQVNHNYYHVTKGIFRLESNEQFMRSMINACR